jgi:hypothetical protein
MVTVKLFGRAGNQMFQIATAIGYAVKHDMAFHIPKRSMDTEKWPCYFPHLTSEVPQHGGIFPYKETAHNYQEIPKFPHIELDGYFQTEKYFLHCRKRIIDGFTAAFIKEVKLSDYISIHVRRGDYLLHPGKHPVITREYLIQAIIYFIHRGYNKFMFFSDDMPWCREFVHNTTEIFKDIHFGFSEGQNELGDLNRMMYCQHHIISNSSFSWWGAWLNQQPGKIVVAPEVWFGEELKGLNVDDICPKDWIRM